MKLDDILDNENVRLREFPVAQERAFFGNAGVAPLPRVAADALAEFGRLGSHDSQENDATWAVDAACRESAARMLGATAAEIALVGPTSYGLNLVALGLAWEPGDEVVYYADDYPANVYPWSGLTGRGVKPVPLAPAHTGAITWDVVARAITPKTRLVALASCHFMSGFRIDVDDIGRRLHERGILFCLDGIQTLGAFPVSVDHVDFLSADSHKWLLGPLGAGIFYVKASRQALLPPALLGSWNTISPDFVAQTEIGYQTGGRRYETGALNFPGIFGMAASFDLLLELGIDAIGERLLHLRRFILDHVRPLGYRLYLEDWDQREDAEDKHRSSIVCIHHPDKDMQAVYEKLHAHKITVSLRKNRAGQAFLRFSPHFYNTEAELARAFQLLA
ncbi:MAG: aminotransferase class V-fold PLP-dependent enzyme [Candidatus Hydrogenedentota bacterium]